MLATTWPVPESGERDTIRNVVAMVLTMIFDRIVCVEKKRFRCLIFPQRKGLL